MRGGNISNKRTHHILTWLPLLAVVALTIPLPAHAASLASTIFDFVLMVGNGLVYISGQTLDWAFDELVQGMGHNFIDNGIGTVINEMWVVVRDLFNILFIFGLIYIGFRTILFSDDTQTKKALGWLIIAALLINFSLFITKGVVDVSNIMADRLHDALTVSTNGSISEAYKRLIEINSFHTKFPFENADNKIVWLYIVGLFLLSLVITITFFAGAFMLFARFIALVFLLIFSPVMFIGMIFPKFNEYTKMYWDRLLNYAFFAPAFIFALLMSARVLQVLSARVGDEKKYVAALSDPSADASVIAYLLIVMAFMIGSIVMAQKMGIAGAGTTMSVFGKLRGGAQNQFKRASKSVGYGAAGIAGRTLVGRPSKNVRKKFDNYIARGGRGSGVLKATGLDRSVRNTLKSGEEAKFGSSYSRANVEDYEKERDNRSAKLNQSRSLEERADNYASLNAQQQQEFRRDVRQASQSVLEELGSALNNPNIAQHLSQQQINNVRSSGEFNDQLKNNIQESRRAGIIERNSSRGTTDLADIRNASNEDIEAIGLDTIRNAGVLTEVTHEHLEALRRSNEILRRDVNQFEADRGTAFETAFTNAVNQGQQTVTNFFSNYNDSMVGSMPGTVISRPEAAPHISARAIHYGVQRDQWGAADRRLLRGNLLAQNRPEMTNYLNTPEGLQMTA